MVRDTQAKVVAKNLRFKAVYTRGFKITHTFSLFNFFINLIRLN